MSKNSKKQIETRTPAQLVQDDMLGLIEAIARFAILPDKLARSKNVKLHAAVDLEGKEFCLAYSAPWLECCSDILRAKKVRGKWIVK